MKTLTLYFFRHGETAANTEGRYIGTTDEPITMQSADMLEKFQKDGVYPSIEALYASPLKRCLQSGILMYPGYNAIPVPNLAEYNFGDFENKTGIELENNEEYKAWIAGKLPAPPNGETGKDFTVRLCVGLRQIVEDMMKNDLRTAAVITHGGVIMTLFDATALPRREKFSWMTDPGRGFAVRITPSLYHSNGIIEVTDII